MAKQTKIGDIITMRGQVMGNTNGHELQLFDGCYDTGYKILEFYIAPYDPAVSNEELAKLHTSATTNSISQWDWANVQEIAWASWGIPSASAGADFFLLDRDNMIIENLYISTYTSGEAQPLNYYITLQKYKITAWDGALNMITNLSQGGPQ